MCRAASWDAPGSFPALQMLDLSGNTIDGSLPEWGQHLQQLQQLMLSSNQLQGTLSAGKHAQEQMTAAVA